ncbi:hypothetical protein SS50377_20195 [Spironucleus salmonicida]|uniref:Uncharacterized protein n=1 Tax=Spironucleus salmonicida TaxID=348837 RepID=V6LKU3_9EUKA|nr:hypothetical protein SS50377_20195 [Spironucleus salmonicida]|eukprot:EST45250.1 Hypothetical protein SS50377_14826 [Spironucleus salmonicida]
MQAQYNQLYTQFLSSTNIQELKKIAFKLDKYLLNHQVRTGSSQGDKLLIRVIELLKEHQLSSEEITLFKAIASHSLARTKFVSWEAVGLFWSQAADLFASADCDDSLQKYTQILIDILYKQSKHKVDPRNDAKSMQKIVTHCVNSADKVETKHKVQLIILLGAIFKNSASQISQFWGVLFGKNAIITKFLASSDITIVREALKTLNIAVFDSRNVFKQAICMPEKFNILSQSIIQGIAIQETIEKLNLLVKNDVTFDLLILSTYENLLSSISWFNLRPQILTLLLESGESIKIKTLILKSLKRDISSSYSFNEFRHGPYYRSILQRFYAPLADTIDFLTFFYDNQHDIWKDINGANNNNQFGVFNQWEYDFSKESIIDQMLFLSSFLAIYPALSVIVDLAPFEENLKLFLNEDGENKIRSLYENMMESVLDEKINEDLLKFNLSLLQDFIQAFQHGLNLTLGVLSKTPEKQTTNYQLQFFLVKNDLKNLVRPPTVGFVNSSLIQFYEDYVIQALNRIIMSSVHASVDFRFFSIIYHTPVQILGLLDDCIREQLQNLIINCCLDDFQHEDESHYERSRVFYAHQTLIQLEITYDDISINSPFIQQTLELLVGFMTDNKNPANLKKPLMQTIGILVQKYLVNANLVEIIIKLASKQSRVQSTALRVIGILFQQLDESLVVKQSNITISQAVSTCLDATNSKDSTFFASVVAIKELYLRLQVLNIEDQTNKMKIVELQSIVFNQLSGKFESVLKNSEILIVNQFSIQQSCKMLLQLLIAITEQPISNQEQVDWVYLQLQSLFQKQYLQKIFDKLDDIAYKFNQIHKKAEDIVKERIVRFQIELDIQEQAKEKMLIYHNFVQGEDGK